MEASTSSAVAPVSASAVEAVRLTVVVPVDVMSVCSIYDAALSLLSMRVWVEEMAVPLLRRTASAFTAEPGGGLSTAVTRYVPGVTSVNVPALWVIEPTAARRRSGRKSACWPRRSESLQRRQTHRPREPRRRQGRLRLSPPSRQPGLAAPASPVRPERLADLSRPVAPCGPVAPMEPAAP